MTVNNDLRKMVKNLDLSLKTTLTEYCHSNTKSDRHVHAYITSVFDAHAVLMKKYLITLFILQK